MGGEGDFIVAVRAPAVVDPAVGAFDDPAAGLDDKPAAGFRPGHHIDGDTGLGGVVGNCRAGVALVHPDVADGWRDALGVAFDAVDLLGAAEAARPGDRGCLTDDESTTAAVSCRRRPDQERTSPRIAVSTLGQMPARHQLRKCLWAADQFTAKSCGWGYRPLAGACRHPHPVRSTYRTASRYSRHRSGGHGRPP